MTYAPLIRRGLLLAVLVFLASCEVVASSFVPGLIETHEAFAGNFAPGFGVETGPYVEGGDPDGTALFSVEEAGNRDETALRAGLAVPDREDVPAQTAGRRVALVIGVNQYVDDRLEDLLNATNDATAVAHELEYTFGFDHVRLLTDTDANLEGVSAALEDWLASEVKLEEHDMFLLYFAGHGVTRLLPSGEARGYLALHDSSSNADGVPVWRSMLAMADIEYRYSESIAAARFGVILDCCFAGLVNTRGGQDGSETGRPARLAITAGSSDEYVADAGGEPGHSVFTGALLAAIRGSADLNRDGEVTFTEVYDYVGPRVVHATRGKQSPGFVSLAGHAGGQLALRTIAASAAPESGSIAGNEREPGNERKPPFRPRMAFEVEQSHGTRLPVNFATTLALGDRISLSIEAEEPSFVYVFNEDADGRVYRLFPNTFGDAPLTPGGWHRLPSRGRVWTKDTDSAREYLYVIAARHRLIELEDGLDVLERPHTVSLTGPEPVVAFRPWLLSWLLEEESGRIDEVGFVDGAGAPSTLYEFFGRASAEWAFAQDVCFQMYDLRTE